MRRTKVTKIRKKSANLRVGQLLLGHTKMHSTVRYLGVELEDALTISKAIEIRAFGPFGTDGPTRTFARQSVDTELHHRSSLSDQSAAIGVGTVCR